MNAALLWWDRMITTVALIVAPTMLWLGVLGRTSPEWWVLSVYYVAALVGVGPRRMST